MKKSSTLTRRPATPYEMRFYVGGLSPAESLNGLADDAGNKGVGFGKDRNGGSAIVAADNSHLTLFFCAQEGLYVNLKRWMSALCWILGAKFFH